jgi:sucrose-6-phosphate hydrolase SacC (GH32 family)
VRAGVRLRCGQDGGDGLPIDYDGSTLRVNETSVELHGRQELTLRIFLDRTVMEVFVDDGELAITQVAYAPQENQSVWLCAEGGEAVFSNVSAWKMHSIW